MDSWYNEMFFLCPMMFVITGVYCTGIKSAEIYERSRNEPFASRRLLESGLVRETDDYKKLLKQYEAAKKQTEQLRKQSLEFIQSRTRKKRKTTPATPAKKAKHGKLGQILQKLYVLSFSILVYSYVRFFYRLLIFHWYFFAVLISKTQTNIPMPVCAGFANQPIK